MISWKSERKNGCCMGTSSVNILDQHFAVILDQRIEAPGSAESDADDEYGCG